MKVELSVFRKLYDPNPRIDLRSHSAHRVLMNVLYIFFPDFTDKSIYVEVAACPKRIRADYESATVALVHLVENATKYAMPNNKIYIDFKESNGRLSMILNMISLKISDLDMKSIFDEGMSGELAKKLDLAGDGIGMFLVKRLLELNGAHIEIFRNVDPKLAQKHMGVPFENNIFEVSFPSAVGV